MAEPESGSVAAEGQPETHGNRLTRAFKKIKPGEWMLIGIGLIGIIIYFLWYRGQQASTTADALTPAGGTSNPWSSSNVDPSQLDADIQALTSAIQNGIATTPGTGTSAGNSAAPGGSVASGDVALDAAGIHSKTSSTTTSTNLDSAADRASSVSTGTGPSAQTLVLSSASFVAAPASSGSGLSQQPNNQAPVHNTTALVHSVNQTAGRTGTVGVPITLPTGLPLSVNRAPANVTPGGQQTATTQTTHGSTPVHIPAGVRPA